MSIQSPRFCSETYISTITMAKPKENGFGHATTEEAFKNDPRPRRWQIRRREEYQKERCGTLCRNESNGRKNSRSKSPSSNSLPSQNGLEIRSSKASSSPHTGISDAISGF